jgi:NADPH:quinone reductase-like Zn-dependent oxidoreductase
MKAAVHTEYGPPEVVRIQELPKPTPKDNEILVRVYAATVNRTDAGFRSAVYVISRLFSGLFKPKQQILGCEFAGVVAACGKSVKNFKVGHRVFGYNDETFGAHAEYLTIAETDAVTHMPIHFSMEEAAAIGEGAHYALFNIRAAKVQKGDKVLVYGATGAIGSAAVQLLKYFGAKVTAVCNTKNVALVKGLGANIVIDYQTQDFTDTKERYSFIFDAVGKSSFGACKPLLTPHGIYISTELGKRSENIFLALITPLFKGKKVLFPIPIMNKVMLVFLKDLAEGGYFSPVIDREYKLNQIVEAYRYVESEQKTGNVIISMVKEEEKFTTEINP